MRHAFLTVILLCPAFSQAGQITIPGPEDGSRAPRLNWIEPRNEVSSVQLRAGPTQFVVSVSNLFSFDGVIRISEFDVFATRLIADCNLGVCSFTADPSFIDVSVITSVAPPVGTSGGGQIVGIMTLATSDWWRFHATTQFGGKTITSPTSVFVPEPTTKLFLLCGLLGLVLGSKRRRCSCRGLRRRARLEDLRPQSA